MPRIIRFVAVPTQINKGESSTLMWNVFAADTVHITDVGYVSSLGTKKVWPVVTTTYTLTATRGDETVTGYVTVGVEEPPPPEPPPPDEPPVICTPGVQKCIGDDLYECSGDGTKWNLEEKDSKMCIAPEACPKWWEDLPGAVWCWIISGIEGLLGWTQGTLLTTLGNVYDLIVNFGGRIYDFFTDMIGSVIDIIRENVGSIFDWLTGGVADLFDFLSGLVGDAFDNIKKFFGDIADFVSDKFMGFVDWLGEIGGSIADYIGGAIGDFVDWSSDQLGSIWDGLQTYVGGFFDWLAEVGGDIVDYIGGAISDFVDWTSDQLGGIWDGITGFFMDAISGFIDAFFGGVETGIEEAKESPLHTDEPVDNPVLKGLQKVVREHRKKYNKDEITGADKIGRF